MTVGGPSPEVGRPDAVDADTAFQLASVFKPIGATVVAAEVGKGTVGWTTPVVDGDGFGVSTTPPAGCG